MKENIYNKYQYYQVNDFVLDESFQQWGLGQADPIWDQFLDLYPEKKGVVEEALNLLSALQVPEPTLSDHEKERYLSLIYHKIEQRESQTIQLKPRFLSTKFKYAASLSAIALLSGLAYYLFFIYPFQYYETSYQQNEIFHLSDGTEVLLNANSSLKVARDLKRKSTREVWLEGEAYFKVNKQKVAEDSSTFVVHTPNLDVQVLGTHFNVRSRKGNTRILLEEGSVKVANVITKENLLMIPGEAVELNADENKIRKEMADEKHELAWQNNFFIFENERLANVANEIFQYYGIQIAFEDEEMADYIFTAEVSREDLPLLKTLIEESFHLKIEHDGDVMRLKRK